MNMKKGKVSSIMFCVMLLLGFEVWINALAQAPQQAQIAFNSDRDGNYDIYVMDADGNNQTRLTNNPVWDSSPAWSPDGQRIAFCSRSIIAFDIYVMDADGNNQTRLTNHPASDEFPCWSPDGKRIAFDSNRDGNYKIYVMDADGRNLRNLTNNPASLPAWSPDGQRIAFVSYQDDALGEIYIMDADGSNQTRLTNNPGGDIFPSWSPDGQRIAFVSRGQDIYVMDADGSNQRNLTNSPGGDSFPCWSPDGKKIAFSSLRDGNWEIYVMDADGSNQRNLTNSPADDNDPDWKKPPCGNIEGYVTDRLTGMALKNAVIVAKKLSADIKVKARSNGNGYYELRCLQPGTWFLVCIKRDYHWSVKVVEVKPVETTTRDFMLRPSVEEDVFELLDSYPNPCNPETWIPYRLPQDSEVTIRIYSATGQLVRTMNLGRQTAGAYLNKNKAAYWNGRNDEGSQVASGLYFYTLQVGKYTATRKMMLLK